MLLQAYYAWFAPARFCCCMSNTPSRTLTDMAGSCDLCMSPGLDILALPAFPVLIHTSGFFDRTPSLQWRDRAGFSPASILASYPFVRKSLAVHFFCRFCQTLRMKNINLYEVCLIYLFFQFICILYAHYVYSYMQYAG